MLISYGAVAGLIAAAAFLLLVLFMIPMLVRSAKALKEVDQTLKTTNQSIQQLTDDVDGLMKQTSYLLDKTNILLNDVNKKMETIDPVVQACADLGESVSELNASSKKMAQHFTANRVKRTGLMSSVLTAILARRKRRRGED